uniref:Poly(A) RNA polymerase mitochondrial-like central palm domain-containing protein n=1 Tax=Rhizophora mucronata TaxID=61149 RepID=A0A2P2KLC4_RHIMU
MESPIQTPLYDTLTLTPPSSAAATPNRSPKADFFEPYTVFRNEISLYDSNAAEASSAPALDFLSLDVDGSDAAHDEDPDPKTPVVTTMNDDPLKALPEPRMENGWFKGYSKFRSPMMQLHKEIVDFCDFLSPTPDEQASRSMAVKCVFGVINYIWPNCKVEVFGSFKTGLYLPTSDIDVVILSSGIKNPQTGLQALGRALSQKGIAKKIQVCIIEQHGRYYGE